MNAIAAFQAVDLAQPGKEQAQVVVDFSCGAHRTAAAAYRVVLSDGDRRLDPVDRVHIRALELFQESQGIAVSGEIGPVTVLALAGQLLHGYTEDAGVLAVGEALLLYARKELACKHSDKIKSIEDGGHYVVTSSNLELPVHERDRRKASEWLEGHRVLICRHVIYNFSNGEMVERLLE